MTSVREVVVRKRNKRLVEFSDDHVLVPTSKTHFVHRAYGWCAIWIRPSDGRLVCASAASVSDAHMELMRKAFGSLMVRLPW